MNSAFKKTMNYIELKHLSIFIKQKVPNAQFDILVINTNDERPHEVFDGCKIYNWCIYVHPRHLSKNMETHVPAVYDPYRRIVTKILKAIFFELEESDKQELLTLSV
jgi:hypothetical protein